MAIENVLEAYGNNLVGAHIDNSSGSGGHTIKDGDGTAMTSQPNLQFADANVSNDGTNNATVIQNFVDIDWNDWQEVDDNDDTYYRVTDAPLVDGNVEVDLMKKLWENPAPTASFASQTITLNSADYDYLLWIYTNGSIFSVIQQQSEIIIKGANVGMTYPITTSDTTLGIYNRSAVRNSDTSYTVNDCYIQSSGSTRTVNNSLLIPIAVYGIKQKVTISLSAIISNVSTSASNCMLSDGETSVEDALNYSTDEHVIGKWIDGSTLYEKTINYGALPNATGKSVAHGISNLGFVTEIFGCAISADGVYRLTFNPTYRYSNDYITASIDNTTVKTFTNANFSSYTTSYITVRYTKTA